MENLANRVLAVIVGCFVIVFFAVVGIGLFIQRQYFPMVGSFIMFDVIFIAALFPVGIIGAVIYFLTRGKYLQVDQYGGYWRNWLGKMLPLPPLAPVAPKVLGHTSIAEISPNIPRIGDLLKQGLLTEQSTEGVKMLMGFRADESPRYERLPGVTAIIGMQNVGKSITMLLLVLIAVFQGAKVIVCDTHHTKARSLFKKLECLAGFVTFALTEEDVLKETRNFSDELYNRKKGSNPYPYVIFYDEFCSLLRSQKVPDLKKVLPVVMEEGSQEGQGYNLHVVCAIHDVSNDGIGDARIRSFFNWIFGHRMEAGQSKFIEAYNSTKTRKQIAGLPAGHVMARDEVSMIEYLIMPYGDSKDVLTARQLLQPGQIAGGSVTVRENSRIHTTQPLMLNSPGQGENSHSVNEPISPRETGSLFTDTLPGVNIHGEFSRPGVNEPIEQVGAIPGPVVTDEDRIALFNAYMELSRAGGKFTRTDLLNKCGWNNRKYPVVKAWCNERQVLKEGSHA